MKILLLKGRSQYNALRIFLDDAKSAFEALGHEVVMLDLMIDEVNAALPDLVGTLGPFDFAFSYVVYGDWRSPDGKSLGELINAPHIIQHVDHPFSHLDRIRKTPRTAAILLIDQSHVDVVKSVFGEDYFANVSFNPHAAIGEAAALPSNAEAFVQSRPNKLFFAGTYYRPDPENMPWKPLPGNVQEVFNEAYELALTHDWIPPHIALIEVLAARGIGAGHETTIALMPFCNLVHEAVRRQRRYQFLRAAAKLKLPLTLYGSGYDKDLYRYKDMDYRGSADFNEIISQMRLSRIVLNVNVNFCEGSHERPMTAMLAGAVCASETSAFYNRSFDVGGMAGDMTCFKWSTLESDLQRIQDMAEDPQALFSMALSGQSKALAGHTWTSRAKHIIGVAKLVQESYH